MHLDLTNLPSDTTILHQLVRDLAGGMEQRDGEIEKLRLIIRQLQRGQFGRRSEQLDPDQLQFDSRSSTQISRAPRPSSQADPSARQVTTSIRGVRSSLSTCCGRR